MTGKAPGPAHVVTLADSPAVVRRVVLGIDPGTALGWCELVVDERGQLLVRNHGVYNLTQGRYEGRGMALVRLRAWLDELLSMVHPHVVALEEVYGHGKAGSDAAHLYGQITGVVMMAAEGAGRPYTGVPVGQWKKVATGKGNASKEEVMAAAVRRWLGAGADRWAQDEADAAFIALAATVDLGWYREAHLG